MKKPISELIELFLDTQFKNKNYTIKYTEKQYNFLLDNNLYFVYDKKARLFMSMPQIDDIIETYLPQYEKFNYDIIRTINNWGKRNLIPLISNEQIPEIS